MIHILAMYAMLPIARSWCYWVIILISMYFRYFILIFVTLTYSVIDSSTTLVLIMLIFITINIWFLFYCSYYPITALCDYFDFCNCLAMIIYWIAIILYSIDDILFNIVFNSIRFYLCWPCSADLLTLYTIHAPYARLRSWITAMVSYVFISIARISIFYSSRSIVFVSCILTLRVAFMAMPAQIHVMLSLMPIS